MCPASDPGEQGGSMIAKRFRAALVTPYGPADLSSALRSIAPLLREARSLGVSWLHLSQELSQVRQEIQNKPLSDATLRGILRKVGSAPSRAEVSSVGLLPGVEAGADEGLPRPDLQPPPPRGIPPPGADPVSSTAVPEGAQRRARLRAQRERLKALDP